MRVHAGALPWWDAHWSRLSLGAARLSIGLPDAGQARAEAGSLFDDGAHGVLKLLLTRGGGARGYASIRSEEHTSELQSLMRISYAVFCLKKKIHTIKT